ncbi:hypothetical protein [Demequina sp.]|uniref:hypothetical protein n=1 Tax=Demequina sp. TaxID=2050685 RepID=UPI0025C28D44|nr:hypothetical protein [Demequina sp.]
MAVEASTVDSHDVTSREAIAAEMESLQSALLDLANTGEGVDGVSTIELAETITELKMQEVAFQGALGTTARVLQNTLKDFLR